MAAWKRSAVLLLTLGLAVATPSCGIFDTRDSEPPGGGWTVPRKEPTNPSAVIFNYTTAVDYFSRSNYEEALAEEFEFIADPEDTLYFLSTVDRNIFRDWGRDEEMDALGIVFADSESLNVTFVPRDSQWTQMEATYRIDYAFRQRITRSGQEDSVAIFKGLAHIHLKEDNAGFWSIDKWEDFLKPGYLTWGRLKGNATPG